VKKLVKDLVALDVIDCRPVDGLYIVRGVSRNEADRPCLVLESLATAKTVQVYPVIDRVEILDAPARDRALILSAMNRVRIRVDTYRNEVVGFVALSKSYVRFIAANAGFVSRLTKIPVERKEIFNGIGNISFNFCDVPLERMEELTEKFAPAVASGTIVYYLSPERWRSPSYRWDRHEPLTSEE
jgi:hypothetical protein